LGATDEAEEGTFKWSYPDINSTFDFSFPFAPEEPDNGGQDDEDCLKLANIGGSLFLKDGKCMSDYSSRFVCEENPLKKVCFNPL